MTIINIHERRLPASAAAVGALLDTLASPDDALWPRATWPAMRFDRPLEVGAAGGHGPIGYAVEEYRPGRLVRFRFTRPRGFKGHHRFEVLPLDGGACLLRHTIEMRTEGWSRLWWPLAVRALHDALLEDALARAEAAFGAAPRLRPWSPWVRTLRWLVSGGRAAVQRTPLAAAEAETPR